VIQLNRLASRWHGRLVELPIEIALATACNRRSAEYVRNVC